MVLAPGPYGSLDGARVFQPAVVRSTNGSYLMYYTGSDGYRNRIFGAYSPDGVVWTKLSGSIYLNDGAGSPFVMTVGSGYQMWFESVVWGVGPLGYTDRIYAANSTDGLFWTISGVVLDVGSGTAWDAGSVGDPSVVRGPDGVYRMYYTMYAANHTGAIGVATSTDLVSFTKWPGNPVLFPGSVGSWDDYAVTNPSAVAEPTWALFYNGRQATTIDQIGLATSADGYHWIRRSAPFLGKDSAGTWDSAGVGGPSFLAGGLARLYFDGTTGNGSNEIGMISVSLPQTGTTTGETTILGLSVWSFAFLVAVLVMGGAVIVVVALAFRGDYRRRFP